MSPSSPPLPRSPTQSQDTAGVASPPFGQAELAALVAIGRALARAQLNEDSLCELIYELAGQLVPAASFQLGLIQGDRYAIKVWVKDGRRQTLGSYPLSEGKGIISWLRSAREPLLVRDFQAEMATLPAQPTYASDDPPRSALFVPLLAGDNALGAISVQSRQPGAFSESHLRLLSVLANQSAFALRNAQLYERGQRRQSALLAVAEVGRQLTRILDLDELLTQVVELIRSRFGYYHVQIFLVEQGSERATFRASSGYEFNEIWRREGRSFRIGHEGIIGWVAEHGEHLLANDVSAEPRYIPDDPRLLPDTRAELALPLTMEGEVLGVLDVQSTEVGAFGEDDLFILRTLADQVVVAVSSARAYETQREEAWTTTVMLQVAEAISQTNSVHDVLDVTVRVTAMLAGAESCGTWLWQEDISAFEFAAGFGMKLPKDAGLTDRLRMVSEEWPALDEMRLQRALRVFLPGDPEAPAPMRALCAGAIVALVPMVNHGEVFGLLGVSFSAELAPGLTERRRAMLSGIAHQVATAVDNSRLTAAREDEAWVSTLMLQVSDAINRLQPVDATLAQVAQLVPSLTGVDRCAILLRDPSGDFSVGAVYARSPELMAPYRALVVHAGDLPLLDDACRLGQPLVVDDALASPLVPAEWRQRFGSQALLAMPLVVADEPVGAFVVDDVETARLFNPRRVRILRGIANQTAVAIENARLQAQEAERARFGRELELAHHIQRSLLPSQAPSVPGYQIAYCWQSAREVGGDFFDFVAAAPLGGKIGIVVADVSDKGIPAALYMMFARTLLRAVAISGRAPAAVLERANDLMLADSRSDMFVTAYYGVLDPAAHRLTYASAGHNLGLHLAAGSCQAEPMHTEGIPLGILAPAQVEERTLDLAPGDLVLFYSDGVTETFDAGDEPFGEERLAQTLCAHQHLPAEAIAEAIQEAARQFAEDTPQSDDFTLVLIKRDD